MPKKLVIMRSKVCIEVTVGLNGRYDKTWQNWHLQGEVGNLQV